jgi:hypothetical protein
MKEKARTAKPIARKQGLVIQELPDEVLVYDLDRDRAHCLNTTAAFVWQRCDGRNTTAQIARTLGQQFDCAVDEKIVWLALDQLGKNHLLDRQPAPPPALMGMNRRAMVRALGLAAIVAVPVVTSIVAPTPTQAATLLPPGSGCSTGAECASGICNTSGSACGQPTGTCC